MRTKNYIILSLALCLTGIGAEAAVRDTEPETTAEVALPIEHTTLIPSATSAVATTSETFTVSTQNLSSPGRPMTINEKRRQRGLTDANNLFVPKGQWIFGGTASYSTHSNDSYQFFVVEGIDSKGYQVKVSPMVAYAISNNMALGVRFTYGRSLARFDNADMQFGDDESGTHIIIKNYYMLRHSYTASAIWRQYIPLGKSKRFAIFNEVQLSYGATQGRFANDYPVKGTYETGYNLSLGVSPGIVAFATNNMAVEVNVGVMGISYQNVKQTHNQVTVGKRETSMMNFKVNIFSIGLGLAFYL